MLTQPVRWDGRMIYPQRDEAGPPRRIPLSVVFTELLEKVTSLVPVEAESVEN